MSFPVYSCISARNGTARHVVLPLSTRNDNVTNISPGICEWIGLSRQNPLVVVVVVVVVLCRLLLPCCWFRFPEVSSIPISRVFEFICL